MRRRAAGDVDAIRARERVGAISICEFRVRLHWLNHAVEWVVFACVSKRDGAIVESDDDEWVAHGRGGAGCGCVDA